MKDGYWKWLKLNLDGALKTFTIIPFAIWDLLKWINDDLRKMTLKLIKKELEEMFSWSNICAGTGAICCVSLMFWLLALGTIQVKFLTMVWWGIGEVVLFLISTYAYWRNK